MPFERQVHLMGMVCDEPTNTLVFSFVLVPCFSDFMNNINFDGGHAHNAHVSGMKVCFLFFSTVTSFFERYTQNWSRTSEKR